jgi:hypothetical protein
MVCEWCDKEESKYEVLGDDLEIYFIGENCKKIYKEKIVEIYKI